MTNNPHSTCATMSEADRRDLSEARAALDEALADLAALTDKAEALAVSLGATARALRLRDEPDPGDLGLMPTRGLHG